MNKVSADVVIIGAGPAGLGTALALQRRSFGGKIIVLERGRHYERRPCPVDHQSHCHGCGGICNVISGIGGSMHYGDGVKLSRFPSGRRLERHLGDNARALECEAIEYLNDAAGPIAFSTATDARLPFPVRHYPVATLSSSQLQRVIRNLHARLARNVQFHLGIDVLAIEPDGSRFSVRTNDAVYDCARLVVATGRAGFPWWRSEIRRLGLKHEPPTLSLGLRFECPPAFLREPAAIHPDFKTTFHAGNRKIKTFCFCADAKEGGGRVKFARYPSYTLLDGHVMTEPSATANFGLLVQLTDDSGVPRTFEWVEENLLRPYERLRSDRSSKPVVQWYPDFKAGALTCDSVAGLAPLLGFNPSVADVEVANLAALVGEYRDAFCSAFEKMLDAFPAPAESFLVYGLELESMWDVVDVSPDFESTTMPGLFVLGDCAGVAQGILQAMTTGIAAARAIP